MNQPKGKYYWFLPRLFLLLVAFWDRKSDMNRPFLILGKLHGFIYIAIPSPGETGPPKGSEEDIIDNDPALIL